MNDKYTYNQLSFEAHDRHMTDTTDTHDRLLCQVAAIFIRRARASNVLFKREDIKSQGDLVQEQRSSRLGNGSSFVGCSTTTGTQQLAPVET